MLEGDDLENFFKKLRKDGVDKVKANQANKVYGENKRQHVIDWLDKQNEKNKISRDNKKAAISLEANQIAEEANKIAKDANKLSWFALGASILAIIISVIVAIVK